MLALFLTLTIALSIYKFERSDRGIPKIIWIPILGVQLIALLTTYSRGGTLVLAIIFALMAVKGIIKPSWEKVLICIAVLFVLVVIVSTTTTAFDRIFSIEHFLESDSIRARVHLMQGGWEMFKDHNWLFGVGLGNYDYYLPEYSKEIPFYYEPNNEFLRIFSEMGILGSFFSIVFFWFTYNDFAKAVRNFRKNNNIFMRDLAIVFQISFIGFLFFSLTQTTIGRKEWPLVMALAIVFRRISEQSYSVNTYNVKMADQLP